MKKTLLSFAAAAVTLTAAAAPAYEQQWTATTTSSQENVTRASAATAVDAAGNVIAASNFQHKYEVVAGTGITRTGYATPTIAKYAADGTKAWEIKIDGSVNVVAITTDAEGNIYLAGTLDGVCSFGTTSGDAIEKAGRYVDDSNKYTYSQANSFVAYYNAEGAVQKVEVFIPEALKAMTGQAGYGNPMSKDICFQIGSIAVDADKNVYCSAYFQGECHVKGADFVGYIDDLMGYSTIGMYMWKHTGAGASFKIAPDGTVTALAVMTPDGDQMSTEEQCQVMSVNATVANGAIYTTFLGNGEARLTAKETQTIVNDKHTYYYYVTKVDIATGELTGMATVEGNDLGFFPIAYGQTVGNISAALADANNAYIVGYQNNDDDLEAFVVTAPMADVATATKAVNACTVDKATFNEMFNATLLADGTIAYAAIGRHTADEPKPADAPEGWEPSYESGDRTGTTKGFTFSNGTFADFPAIDNAYSVAAAGSNIVAVAAAVNSTEVKYLKGTKGNEDGIASVAADGAAAEYFNLQGIRVANPTSGLYIRRQGNTATKVLVK